MDLGAAGNKATNISDECSAQKELVEVKLLIQVTFVIASISIFVLLCFIQRRRSLCPDCCWARPSLPVPMDFLVNPYYRLPYILLFALLAVDVWFTTMTVHSLVSGKHIIVNTIYKLVIVPLTVTIQLGVKYFPLLACVQASSEHVGHFLGLAYSLIWFTLTLVETLYEYLGKFCGIQKRTLLHPLELFIEQIAKLVLQSVPVLLIALALIGWYLFRVIKHQVSPEPKRGVRDYHLLWVRRLLSRKRSIPVLRGRFITLLLKIVHYFVPYNKYVKLPLPFLCVVVAMVAFLYQLTLYVVLKGVVIINSLTQYVNLIVISLDKDISDETRDAIRGIQIGISASFAIALFVSLVLCVFLLLHMVSSTSKKVKEYARKGFTEKLPSLAKCASSAWTYLGVQLGLFVYAWAVFSIVGFVLCLAAMAMCLGLKYFPSDFLNLLFILIFPLLWTTGLFYSQFLLCKFVFFERSSGKFISIKNKRLFNWLAYLLFLYNGFAGIVKAIMRVAITACITLFLLFRLDIVTLTHGFGFFDFGHKAFLGFFYLNYCYNNAVVHTFIHLLESENGLTYSDHIHLDEKSSPDSGRKRAHNRWLLAYTLLRNPSVIKLRANNLVAGKELNLCTSQEDV